MTKTDLTAKTVAELKSLAKKKKVSLSAGAKKSDIVDALLAVIKIAKSVATRAVKSVKAASKKGAVPRKSPAKKAVIATPAASTAKKVVAKPKGKAGTAPKRPAQKKRTPAGKTPGPATPIREWKMPPNVEEPLMAQARVSEAKYYTGPPQRAAEASVGELPLSYGEEKIVLLSRDPYVAYAYWETTPKRIDRERAWFGLDSKLCIRIYDITGIQFDGRNAAGYFDQEISDRVGSWYFNFERPTHSFCADLGLITPQGKFLTLTRSNYITMPRDGVSDVIDEEWLLVDEEFWKLYGYPAGFRQGISSPEMQEMLRRRRLQEITSPGTFSRERAKRK